jgi:hypothetical protein
MAPTELGDCQLLVPYNCVRAPQQKQQSISLQVKAVGLTKAQQQGNKHRPLGQQQTQKQQQQRETLQAGSCVTTAGHIHQP